MFVSLVVCIDRSVDIDVFFYKRKSLKARKHETEGIFVDLIVR